MVMCAGNEDHTKVELMRPYSISIVLKIDKIEAKVGERVTLEGSNLITQDKGEEINPDKTDVLKIVFKELKTDGEGYATYLGKIFLFQNSISR